MDSASEVTPESRIDLQISLVDKKIRKLEKMDASIFTKRYNRFCIFVVCTLNRYTEKKTVFDTLLSSVKLNNAN